MDDITLSALTKWKAYCYRDGDLPFATAVRSLVDDSPLIEVKQSQTRKSDWVLCRPGTTTPANFVYAGVFSDADPYETGNFVWGKEDADPRLDESRVARFAGFRAAYSYALETYHDQEIWELQQIMDLHMESVQGFNSRSVKRREWQNGTTWFSRYYLRTPIFLSCEGRGGQPEPPEGLHEWVVAAHKKSKTYRANPIRPAVCGLDGGRMRKIADCTPNSLEYGDVVSVVFNWVYTEDKEDWGPVPHVSHIIRVQAANRVAYPLTSALVMTSRPAEEGLLQIGAVIDEEQAAKAAATPSLHLQVEPRNNAESKGKGVDRSGMFGGMGGTGREKSFTTTSGSSGAEYVGASQSQSSDIDVAANVQGATLTEPGCTAPVDGAGRVPSAVLAAVDNIALLGGGGDDSVQGLGGPRGEKRRMRARSASEEDDDDRERGRRARPGNSGAARRGTKGGK